MAHSRRHLLNIGASGIAAMTTRCVGHRADQHHFSEIRFDTKINNEDRFADLKGFCQGIPDIDESEYEERRERARKALRKEGFDLLVVEAGQHLRFLTGVRWGLSERPLLFLLPSRGPAIWISPGFEENTLRLKIGESVLAVWQEHENAFATLEQVLRKLHLHRPRLALDPNMRLFVAQGIRNEIPDVSDASSIIDYIRIAKTPRELARLRRANEATKAAIRSAARFVKAGMTEPELGQLLHSAQTTAGLDNVWVLPLIGTNAAFPHGTNRPNRLKERDGILVDTGGSLFGYCSDITRTWAYGHPSDDFRRAWDTVLLAQQSAKKLIRPGIRCGEVDFEARQVLSRAGFGSDYETFTHRLGHGIGIQVHEAPYLVRNNPKILRKGMTMSIEPGIYLPNKFGIRIEDIIAVTEDSHEVFGPTAISLDTPFG